VKRWTFFLILVVAAIHTAYAEVKYIAVVETEVDEQSGARANINKAEVRQITAVLRKEALKNLPSKIYNIMTSETVQAQGSATLEQCSDENCVITLGSMIGADFIVRGTVSKFGTKLTVSVDIYETNDGNLVASSELVKSEKIEGLLEMTATACGEMYKTFLSDQAQKVKPKAWTAQATEPTYQSPATTYQPSVHTPTSTLTPTPKPTQTYQQSIVDASGTLTDSRDRKRYKTLVIGGKRWMAENMNYKMGKSWCYSNDNSNCDKYGRLYDWKTAKTVCPAGYHLPSRQEWDNLMAAMGGKEVAGKKLKTRSGWKEHGNGTDDFGFSALPSGNRNSDGYFINIGNNGRWWTATERGNYNAYRWGVDYNLDNADEGSYFKSYGYSVRCVADGL
jgi:uncharacterized protein (TIGR02145 family)